MNEAPLPARPNVNWGVWRWLAREPSRSMKWPRFPLPSRPNSCGCSKSGVSSGCAERRGATGARELQLAGEYSRTKERHRARDYFWQGHNAFARGLAGEYPHGRCGSGGGHAVSRRYRTRGDSENARRHALQDHARGGNSRYKPQNIARQTEEIRAAVETETQIPRRPQ